MAGIGLELTKRFLSRNNTVVIAAVRNPNNATSTSALLKLSRGAESALLVIKIDSLDNSSAASGIATISGQVDHIDLVIANAGVSTHYGPVSEMSLDEIPTHIAVNTVAPIALLQATKPLLQNARTPKFVVMSTALGSIAEVDRYPMRFGAYGASKAAINYLMRKVHFEETWLTSMVICPGWAQTDMGNASAKSAKFGEQAPVPLDISVNGLVEEVCILPLCI